MSLFKRKQRRASRRHRVASAIAGQVAPCSTLLVLAALLLSLAMSAAVDAVPSPSHSAASAPAPPASARFSRATAEGAAPLVCPMGWRKVASATGAAVTATFACMRVMGSTDDLVSPADTPAFCTSALTLHPPRFRDGDSHSVVIRGKNYTYAFTAAHVQPISVHSGADNEAIRRLFADALATEDASAVALASLGGKAGFGETSWFDNSASDFTNFDASAQWTSHSGCIGMRLFDGKWVLLPCEAVKVPYMCSFPLSTDLLIAVPTNNTSSSSSTDGSSASSTAFSASSLVSSSSADKPPEQAYAQRPPVPEPIPACLSGWSALPADPATPTTTQDGAMCYRAFAPAGASGTFGKTFDAASAFCAAQHPHAALASVFSAAENAWVMHDVIYGEARLRAIADAAQAGTVNGSAVTQSRRTVVFLGAIFMRDGPDTLLGNWKGDKFIYGESEHAQSSPSSPAWPTATNHYFSNWAVAQPRSSSGCLAMALYDMRIATSTGDGATTISHIAAGEWVSEDCRSTQPFVCAYVNDGTTFPPLPSSESSSSFSGQASSTTRDPVSVCLDGWTLHVATGTCYRVATAVTPSTAAVHLRSATTSDVPDDTDLTGPVSPAMLEDRCMHELTARATNPEIVHSALITTPDQSAFVGELLVALSASVTTLGQPAVNSTIVGVSFFERGASGLYLDGVTTLSPRLANSLWAVNEPSREKGCVAVNTGGWWVAVPCGQPGEAYTCQYAVDALVLKNETPTVTHTPVPTHTPTPPSSDTVPLTERIASLSGAVHLVVSAGTVGIYTVKSRGGSVDGLLFYFAPLSPFYTHPEVAAATAAEEAGQSTLPPGPHPFGEIFFDNSSYAPCSGYKKQEELSAVFGNKLTVRHGRAFRNSSSAGAPLFVDEVGYVCVSENGKDYFPTRITYEVVGTTLKGLIPVASRHNVSHVRDSGTLKKLTTYLPPLFHSADDALAMAEVDLGIQRYTSGTLQVAVQSGVARAAFRLPTAATAPMHDHGAAVSEGRGYLSHLRLSPTPDCMDPAFTFLQQDLPLMDVSQNRQATSNATADADAAPIYALSYQWADIAIGNLSRMNRLVDPSPGEDTPVNFYVCVAARKRSVAASTLFPSWNVTAVTAAEEFAFGNASNPLNLSIANAVAMKRMLASSSLAAPSSATPSDPANNEEVRLYAAVPGLRVHVVAPPVSLNGMWVVPPQPLAHVHFAANASAAVRAAALHPTLLVKQTTAAGLSGYHVSSTTVHVPQYSSPILILDGEGVREGMSLLLSRMPRTSAEGQADHDDDGASGDGCSREQHTPQPDPANPDVPATLDTMLPISLLTVPVTVLDDDGSGATAAGTRERKVAFAQLNLNVTGMWGTNMSTQHEQKWRVCFSYTTTGEFLPVKPLIVVVDRMNITAVTAVTAAGAIENEEGEEDSIYTPSASTARRPQLNVNVGFTGLWRLWGVDVRMWSAATLHNAQVTFANALPDDDDGNDDGKNNNGNGGVEPDPALQCASASLFYNQKGLGIVAPPSAAMATNAASAPYAALVIPPGFLQDVSVRRMRLCLSIPQPFHATRRVFYPTTVTVGVHPIQILYIGLHSAVAAGNSGDNSDDGDAGTVLRVAEGADNVVFPLVGYGIRADMILFLSDRPCYGRQLVGDMANLVGRQSLFNISLAAPFDLPPNYWAATNGTARQAVSKAYMILKQKTLTMREVADALFGPERNPLRICLFAPGTRAEVHGTAFRLVVLPPLTRTVVNMAEKDAALIALAMGNRTFAADGASSNGTVAVDNSTVPTHETDFSSGVSARADAPVASLASLPATGVAETGAIVVYAAYMDLLVDGFGLLPEETQFIPAVDCANASSFLWRNPVGLSPIPSSRGSDFFAESERYIDPQTSTSSWFLPIRQSESIRIGAEEPADGLVDRFMWCVRYRARDAFVNVATSSAPSSSASEPATASPMYDWTRGFVSTGIPYRMVIPRVDGFRFGQRVSQRITLPVQDKELGEWQKIQLVGPLIDITFDVGNPLYMFLADEALSCKDVKNYHIKHNLTAEKMILAVNGSAVIMPKLLSSAGTYKFCTSAVYPEARSVELDTEAALQFVALPGLRLELFDPVYAVFSLNHSTSVTVEQGQEWALPIAASQLSNHSLLRFQPPGTSCAAPMVFPGADGTPVTLPDITVRNAFEGVDLFGTSAAGNDHFVVLEQDFIRALPAQQLYQLCFKPNRAVPWTASPLVTLRVLEHVRRPSVEKYFPADGSQDVVGMTALAPTKVALDWLTGEPDTDNVVGALGREVVLALRCLNGSATDTGASNCSCSEMSAPSSSSTGTEPTWPIRDNDINRNSMESTTADASGSSAQGCSCDPHAPPVVPCGDHLRVMFVKPMDDDSDPCFVDHEAIQDTIVRGPYVMDDGILTIPRHLSGIDVAFYPNMTQPWIMCLETGPERWREPIYPLFQLQFTGAIPVGFRAEPDDPSNTTATFPGTHAGSGSSATAAPSKVTGDRTEMEGNATLHLYAGDSSQVYYLNGYGIQRGFSVRFGARCDEDITAEQMAAAGVTSDNVSHLVASRQKLSNTLLYTAPLMLEDDHGVFLVPRSHQRREETYVLPMCLSTDGGASYAKTGLAVTVLPSRLKRDVPLQEEDLVERVLGDTLVVPLRSSGSVNVTHLAARAAAKLAQSAGGSGGIVDLGSSSGEPEWPAVDDEGTTSTTRSPAEQAHDQATNPFFPAGTVILLSSSCTENVERLPTLTVSTPNVLTLTTRHTGAATDTRLTICAKFPETSTTPANSVASTTTTTTSTHTPATGGGGGTFLTGGTAHEVIGSDDDSDSAHGSSGSSTRPVMGFKDTGLHYRVLNVSVGSVSVHTWAGNSDVEQSGIQQLVLRRASEDLLLSVSLTADESSSGASAVEDIGATCTEGVSVSEDCIKEVFLHMLDAPGALPFFSLARFRIGKPCLDVQDGADHSAASTVVSSAAFKATFRNSSLSVSSLRGSSDVRFVAPLPASPQQQQYPPWAPGSLCLSVDGGRHYLSVGIAYFTADWAPTLRAQLNPMEEDNDDDADAARAGYTNNITLYEQTSVYAKLSDTRYDASIYYDPSRANVSDSTSSGGSSDPAAATTVPFDVTPTNVYMNRFTTDALWSGFLGESGFASQGVLYLPSTLANLSSAAHTDAEVAKASQELLFYASNRFIERTGSGDDATGAAGSGEPTSLRLIVEPFYLWCVGEADYTVTEEYMRRLDNGRLLPVADQCGGAGIPEGATLRLVDSHDGTVTSAEACAAPEVHASSFFALDMSVMKPFLWAPSASHTTTTSGLTSQEGLRESATQIQLPPSLRYMPDGTYHVCLKKYLWSYKEASRLQAEAVYVPAAVQLLVTSNLTILRVARATSGIVAIYQGTNTAVPIEGTVVGLRGVPLLMGLAPVLPHPVTLRGGHVMNLTRGCLDLPALHDPVTGESRINLTTSIRDHGGPPEDLLLTTPWLNAQDGLWRVPAAYLRHITNQTLYFLCYSVNDGIAFDFIENRLADVSLFDDEDGDAATIPRVVTVAVRPPTMVGVALNSTAQGVVAQDMYTRRSAALRFDPGWLTPSALRVHRLSHLTNATNPDAAHPMWPSPAQPATVRIFTHHSVVNEAPTELALRVPSYYFNPTNTLVGSGMGVNSFRAFWPTVDDLDNTSDTAVKATGDGNSSGSSSSGEKGSDGQADAFMDGYFTETEEETVFAGEKDRVPSTAAAVAVLRTSRFGQICSGALPNYNVSYHGMTTSATSGGGAAAGGTSVDGVLAMPIFLLNLRTTTVWSDEDDAHFDESLAALTKAAPEMAAAVHAMNPVLNRTDYRANTATLRRRYIGTSPDSLRGALNLLSVLAMATSESEAVARAIGESLLICVSVDGVNFYSANAHVLPSVGSVTDAYVPVPGVNSDAARRALRLRRLAGTAPTNRPIPLLNVSSVPMLLRPEPVSALTPTPNATDLSPLGTFAARDVSLRTSLVVRPNLTALTTAEAVAGLTPTQWHTALDVAPSAQMLARLVDALSHEIGVEAAVFVAQVQPTGSVAAPSAAALTSVSFRAQLLQRAAGTTAVAAPSTPGTIHLPTYDLIISIAADAYLINGTSQTRTLTASPDILLRVVEVLRHNATQHTVLKPLLFLPRTSPRLSELKANPALAKLRDTAYVSSVAMNLTFGNGIDMSRVMNVSSTSRPASAASHVLEVHGVNYTLPTITSHEMEWRNAFMAVPHDTVNAVPIPDDPNNDTTGKMTWWVVPLMLIFPIFLVVGTYYVYKKYFKKKEEMPAEDVTVTQ